MRAFRGSAENARATVMRRGIDYVLICPGLSESTIYRSRAPKGFYVQLSRDQVPDWLERVELPEDSPSRMWRVRSEEQTSELLSLMRISYAVLCCKKKKQN